MKVLKILLALSIFTFSGAQFASAADAVTEAVGFTTLTIDGDSLNFIGLSMVNVVEFQSVVDSVNGDTVTFTGDASALNQGTYFFELVSGALEGLNSQVADITGNSIQLGDPIGDLHNAADITGASFRLRQLMTLGRVFGDSLGSIALKTGGSASEADEVLLYDGTSFTSYYFQKDDLGFLGGDGWRTSADSFTDATDTPIYFTDGVVVKRKDSAPVNIKLLGSVKTGKTSVGLGVGLNFLANPYPVTLGTSGLYTDGNTDTSLNDGASASEADEVLINDAGAFSSFYYQIDSLGFLGGDGWRSSAGFICGFG